MPATQAPTGYSRLQIALHWLVFALIAQQYLSKGAMSAAWGRMTDGLAVAFDPLVLAQGHNVMKIILLALVALHVIGALYHQFILRDGTLARMRRAQG